MAKNVQFNIKLNIDGKERIVTAKTSVEELAKAMTSVQSETDKAKTSLSTLGSAMDSIKKINLTQSFANITSSLQTLTGVMHNYAQISANSEQAGIKLETVMRQRMKATSEEVQSIQQLAGAQVKLGVVSKGAQIEGAQQLSTFLNQKSSIEVLLPAMNNLLAQQNGYNTTAQDAIGIGNLMGKAMQGQTAALRRVGITFTEAQGKILKYGTETQRAAMLAQVITDNVGNMNAELGKTDIGKAMQLKAVIGGIKKQLGNLFISFEPAILALGELGMAISAIGTLQNGIKATSTALLGFVKNIRLAAVSTVLLSGAQKVGSVVTAWWSRVQHAATQTMYAYVFGANAGTIANNAFRTSMMFLSGVAPVIAIIGAIAGAIYTLSSNADEATSSTKELSSAAQEAAQAHQQESSEIQQHTSMLELNIQKLKNFKGTKEQEKKIVEEMNDTYGETMGYFSSVNDWYNALIKNSKAYTQQMILEAQARRLANDIATKEESIRKIRRNDDGTLKKYSSKREKEVVFETTPAGFGEMQNVRYGKEIVGSSDLDKANAKLAALYKSRDAARKQLEAITQKASKNIIPVQGAKVRPSSGGTSAKPKPKPKPTKDTTAQKEELKLNENAKTLKDFENNARYYEKQLESANATEAVSINKSIAFWRDKADAVRNAGKEEKPAFNEAATTLEGIDQNISILQARLKTATKEQAADINKQIEKWQQLGDAITNAGKDVLIEQPTSIADIEQNISILQRRQRTASRTAVAGYNDQIAALQKLADQMGRATNILPKDDTFDKLFKLSGKKLKIELHAVGIDKVRDKLKEVNELLNDPTTSQQNKKILTQQKNSLEGYEEELGKTSKTIGTLNGISKAAGGIQQLGQAFQQLGDDSKAMAAATTAASLAASLSAMIAGMVEKANKKTLTIWDWIAGIGAGTAAVVSAAAQLKGVGAFAKGGVVSGPTLALVGEYAGASNNPEVIAPLDKLRSMIKPQGGFSGDVQFKIAGRQQECKLPRFA